MQEQQGYEYRPEESQQQIRPDLSAGSEQNSSNAWKYVLTGLITALFTFILTAAIGLAVFFSFSGSSLFSESGAALPITDSDSETMEALNKLRDVYRTLNDNYYRELSDAEMLEAMASGLAGSLDSPYTMYFTAEQNELVESSYSGEYSGIGAIVSMNQDNLIEIVELIADSPAIEAGLQVGDIFLTVDGQDVTSVPDVSTLAAMVKGPEGTKVELEMYRPITDETVTVTPERRRIESPSVRYHMIDEVTGYLAVSEFSTGVSDHFIEAVDALQSEGAESIIFDLRNNSGGLADEVTRMLDYLLPEATIASLEGRRDGEVFKHTWDSDASAGVPQDMPFVVLVNQFSASASELFAGCLHDYDRAYLIGQQTFGKGSGTVTFKLDDGSAVNVTNFLYYLPDGESIEGTGLVPDLNIELPEAARVKSIIQLSLEEDTQLSAALDWLQKKGTK
jgi:carboxyl-terminal processing protease